MLQICPAQAITIEAEEREDGSRRTTRYVLSNLLVATLHVSLEQAAGSLDPGLGLFIFFWGLLNGF